MLILEKLFAESPIIEIKKFRMTVTQKKFIRNIQNLSQITKIKSSYKAPSE